MANWTLQTTEVSGGDLTQNHIVILGNSLYYIDSGGGVSQYNKDTDSVQVILDPATVGITAVVGVAAFKSTLYASAYTSGTYTTEVWQYGGSVNNWTQVLAKNNTALNAADLACNSSFMMVIERAYVGGVWVTTDGTSWNAASTVPVNNYIDGLANRPNYASNLPLTFIADYQAGDPATDSRASQLTSASTVAVIANYATHLFSAQNPDYLWFENSGSGDYEYSLDGAAFVVSPEGSDVYPVISQNMPYSVGGDTGATVYYFTGGAWVGQGDLPENGVSKAFRFSDGVVMVVGAATGALYVSDEPIIPTGGLKFYSGVGSLTYRCDLPFASINNPGCMAVRSTGEVVVGAAAAGSGGEIVVKLSPADDFTTPEDITGSLSDPVKAVVDVS